MRLYKSEVKYFLLSICVISLTLYTSFLFSEQSSLQFNPTEWNLGETEVGKAYSREIQVKVEANNENIRGTGKQSENTKDIRSDLAAPK